MYFSGESNPQCVPGQKTQKNTNNLSPRWNHRKNEWKGFLEVIQVSLENCQGRKFPTSLVNLFQCLTTLSMEEFLPYMSLAFLLLCLVAGKFSSRHFTHYILSKSGAKFSFTAWKESLFPYPIKSTFLLIPVTSVTCGVQDKEEVKKNQLKLTTLINENKSQLPFLINGSKATEMYQMHYSFQFCGINSPKSRLPLIQREKEGESLGFRAEEEGKLFQSFKWKER